MAMSSLQIHNKKLDVVNQIADLTEKFNAADNADAKDALRDKINALNGEVKTYDEILGDVLNEEDKIRRAGGVPLADPSSAAAFKPKNLAQAVLGNPKDFKGIDINKGLAVVLDEFQDFKLVEHKETQYDLPAQYAENLPNFGILSTLPTATTNSDSVTFFEADPTKLSNAADTWTPGNTIKMSGFAWKQRSFHMEQIANGVPIVENNLRDYGTLAGIINTTLLYMQELAKSQRVVRGPKANAETGIVGILEHDGIQKFTKAAGDTIADCAYKMANDVFLNTGYYATTLAVHPYVAESIVLDKDKQGRYMNQMVNGKLWALNVVQDLNLFTEKGETGAKTYTYGMMAYAPNAATFYTKLGETLEIGLVNDQFIRNEKTVRINGQYGLEVRIPKCFSYLADTGVSGR